MRSKHIARNAYREIEHDGTPPRHSIIAKSGAVLVPPVDANPWFPCTIDPETHELRYFEWTDEGSRLLPIADAPAEEIQYTTPFHVVPQGQRLFIVQEKTHGHPHNDKDRKYGFISVDTSTGERTETGLRYAHAGFVCGDEGREYYGKIQLTDRYAVYAHDQISFLGGVGLINDRLETLIEPSFRDISLTHANNIDFAIAEEIKDDRRRFGLFNIHTRTWVVSCEYDYIAVTSKYFLLIQGWLDYGYEADAERAPLTRILDLQCRPVVDIPFTVYYDHHYSKSDPDAFLFVHNKRWGKVGIDGVVLVQPQFEFNYDVPDKDYALSDIKLAHTEDKRCVLTEEDISLVQRLMADAPMNIQYEGTELGAGGQAHVAALSIDGIPFLSIDAEYEDFKFVVALQDATTFAKGTVLVKRTKSKSLTSLATNNTKLYNYLQNILAQADLFIR